MNLCLCYLAFTHQLLPIPICRAVLVLFFHHQKSLVCFGLIKAWSIEALFQPWTHPQWG